MRRFRISDPFGLILSLVKFSLKNSGNPNLYIIGISGIFLVLGILNSKILSPFNQAWIRLGELLGTIIAPIVMALVYFVVLTPISLIVRISGKDLLELKFLKKRETYWIKRKKHLSSMKKQF